MHRKKKKKHAKEPFRANKFLFFNMLIAWELLMQVFSILFCIGEMVMEFYRYTKAYF